MKINKFVKKKNLVMNQNVIIMIFQKKKILNLQGTIIQSDDNPNDHFNKMINSHFI